MLPIGIAIGLAAGLLSGLLGIAGGVLMIPLMVLLLHLDQKTAQGTSLAVLLPPTGLFAFIEYYRHGWVNLHLGIGMVIGLTAGAFAGAYLVQFIDTNVLRKVFAVFLVLIAIRVWFE
ncbi:MAG: sulfite exporter TauE/SafE family protein [Acidobacteria bacterium]|nr:sulfite exporter TauE/SafE family protein [Acidobacteriota bacterium]